MEKRKRRPAAKPRSDANLSELRHAQEDLRRSLSLLRATLDSTADGILVVDENGKILTYNRRFVEMWRIPDDLVSAGQAGLGRWRPGERLENDHPAG